MKRKRQIIIQIILIAIFGLLLFDRSRLYRTPQEFLRANEKGLHYGPSDKILLEGEYTDGYLLVIGKIGDDALSIGEGKRKLLFFWGMPGGGFTGYRPISEDKAVMAEYLERFHMVVGLTNNKDIEEVEFKLFVGRDHAATERARVDEDGFFMVRLDDGLIEKYKESENDYVWFYPLEIKGFDKDGNLIYEELT
ncbi:MAG: hypothetical protein E7235_02410 [Lachnospiraceae bacterium]|nr:hypothetical protein [Lachnospiraceae bacterium]